ncbi:MAG: shikimate kinase [Actinomycetes bacterium]
MSSLVVLVGVPGAGKTSVGRALAELLGVDFVDTDDVVEQTVGKPVADIFVEDGEVAFREYEREAVARALGRDGAIVALGGGAVMNPDTRALLAGIPTLWLQVSADIAAKRVGLGVSRPMLLGGVRSRMVTMARERQPMYEEVATMSLSTDSGTAGQIAGHVREMLEDDHG